MARRKVEQPADQQEDPTSLSAPISRRNVFGIVNPAGLTPPLEPSGPPTIPARSRAGWLLLFRLHGLVHRHHRVEVGTGRWAGAPPLRLGDAHSREAIYPDSATDLEADAKRCPLADEIRAVLATRTGEGADTDGLEVFRAGQALWLPREQVRRGPKMVWPLALAEWLRPDELELLERPVREDGLRWAWAWAKRLADQRLSDQTALRMLDGAVWRVIHDDAPIKPKPLLPAEQLAMPLHDEHGCTVAGGLEAVLHLHNPTPSVEVTLQAYRLLMAARPAIERQVITESPTLQWFLGDMASVVNLYFQPEFFAPMVLAGLVSADDLLDYALSAFWMHDEHGRWTSGDHSPLVAHGEQYGPKWWTWWPQFWHHPVAVEARRRYTQGLIRLERERKGSWTAASRAVSHVKYGGDLTNMLAALDGLGDRPIDRRLSYEAPEPRQTLSHFLRVTGPSAEQTPAVVAQALQARETDEKTLLTLAMFAPQWAPGVEAALGSAWSGLTDGVYWVHAHIKDYQYRTKWLGPDGKTTLWADRSTVPERDRADGVVDRAWLLRVVGTLGEKRWQRLLSHAVLACVNTGHLWVRLASDAALGKRTANEATLLAKVASKRDQRAMKALGLVPLRSDEDRTEQVWERYQALQEVLRTGHLHGGATRRTSEKRAVEIGLGHLAQVAGYTDEVRLTWAMERHRLRQLRNGRAEATAHGVTVSVEIDGDAKAAVSVRRGEKQLRSLPAKVRASESVASVLELRAALRRSGVRVRQTLERMMVDATPLSCADIAEMWEHPVVRHGLERLVLIDAGGTVAGYPVITGWREGESGGAAADRVELAAVDGTLLRPPADGPLRIAHPLDLLSRGDWHRWQHGCFVAERVQPFKQIFREVYLPLEAERTGDGFLTRYQGCVVVARRASGVLGGRGWRTDGDLGARKELHGPRLVASLGFEEGLLSDEPGDLATVAHVMFAREGSEQRITADAVPPLVFSEVMRDVDLVVAAAAPDGRPGTVSPSTVEMRGRLLAETCAMLGLDNVAVADGWAHIRGSLAAYSVSVSDGAAWVVPGGELRIKADFALGAGPLFLPHVDNDPVSVRVLSVALALARDEQGLDPALREEIERLRVCPPPA